MTSSYHKLFFVIIAILSLEASAIAQLPKHYGRKLEKTYPIDLQRHIFTTIKYPDKAERSYIQGNTIAYFKVNNRKITLLSIAPKLTIDFKNEIIKVFKNFETKDLKNGYYGIPIWFRIHNVITKIHNEEIDVHQNYIDLPYIQIYIGNPNYCDATVPHIFCEEGTLHSWIDMRNPPEYPGGYKSFIQFLNSQIKYPKAALKAQVQGNVFVSFIIEKDGSLSMPKIQRTLGYGTDEEAIRVLKLSQKWKPGLEKGKPVRTIYHLPISFVPERPFKNPKPIKIYLRKNLKNPPQYLGGEEKLNQFLKNNINYTNLTNKQIKGTIVVKAVVEMDGSLTQLKAIDDLGYGTKREALRVVSKLRRWNPGMENGIPTRTLVTIPVHFNP